jgi:hypothetical protein
LLEPIAITFVIPTTLSGPHDSLFTPGYLPQHHTWPSVSLMHD